MDEITPGLHAEGSDLTEKENTDDIKNWGNC